MDINRFINRRLSERDDESPMTIRARESLVEGLERDVDRRLQERRQKRAEEERRESLSPGGEGFEASVFGRTHLDTPDGPRQDELPRTRTPEVRAEEADQRPRTDTTMFNPLSLSDMRDYGVRGVLGDAGEFAAGFVDTFYRQPLQNVENITGADFGSATDTDRGLQGPRAPGQGLAGAGESLGTGFGMVRDLGVSSVAGAGVGGAIRGTQLARTLAQGGTTARNVGRAGRVVPEEVTASTIYTGMQGEDFTRDLATVLGARAGFRAVGAGARTVPKIREGRRFMREEAGKDPRPKVSNLVQAARTNNKTLDKALSSTPVERSATFLREAQKKLQSNLAPLNRELDGLVSSGKITRGRANAVKAEIQTAKLSSDSMANNWRMGKDLYAGDELIAKGSQNIRKLTEGLDGKILDTSKPSPREQKMYDYFAAQDEVAQLLARRARGDKIDTKRLKSLQDKASKLEEPEFVQRNQYKNDAYEELGDILVSQGLVDKATMNYWRSTNQSYARIQREIEDLSQTASRGSGRGVASRGSTVAEQKVKGSTREVVNPVLTLMDYSNRVFREVASNRAANAFIDTLTEAGTIGRQLRSADDVLERTKLREALAESRPVKQAFQKLVKSNKSRVTKLQREIKRMQDDLQKKKVSTVNRSLNSQKQPEMSQDAVDAIRTINTNNVDEMYEGLLELKGTPFWANVRRGISSRDRELAEAMNDLDVFSQTLNSINLQRKLDYQEILKRRDQEIQGKPTIQRRVNGIKEIYETTPEIEIAAKSLGPVYMGAFGRAVSAPVRLLQATITGGLNPAWAAYAITRDLVEGVVLSSNARATHHPLNIVQSLADMTGGGNRELFERFLATERGASSVIDLTRGAKSNAKAIREASRMSIPKYNKAGTIIRNPSDLWTAIQDASRWNEHYTKYVGFRGTYNDLIKQGIDEQEAFRRALWEARNVSGNLLETGDWSRAAQAVFPYFNPSIQGGASLEKAFKTRPGVTSAKVLTAIQMPAAVLTAWNLSDPRRAEIYTDIPPDQRERFNIFILPGSEKTNGEWQVLKLPKAPGVGNLANPVERTMLAMYGHDAEGFENFAQSIVKSMGMPFDVGSRTAFVGSTIPFQARVPAEQAINYSFYRGKQIVPDWMVENNPDEPYKRAYDNTSSTFTKIAKALDISPLMVQNLANNTLGEFGRNVTYASDVAQEYAQLSEEGSTVGGRSPAKSLTRAYFGSYGGAQQSGFREEISSVIDSKQDISSGVTELINSRDITGASRRAGEYNRKIDALIRRARENPEFVEMSEAQRDYLESLKFPMSGGRLSDASIRSRRGEFDR